MAPKKKVKETSVVESSTQARWALRSKSVGFEGSGPRHTRSRGVDALPRRAREEHRVVPIPIPEDVHYSLGWDSQDEDELDNMMDVGGSGDRADMGDSTSRATMRKGRGERFVGELSSAGTSQLKSRATHDTTWLVEGPMLGGPLDGA
ncbi:uncharacterized protein LOC130591978 [Beta vulgaris subsp. vulgaris]|uniref:uncharacterized protein LOC130591978 n=1 Tax=Beta vulgaris subsp. vulgaris TaxID=3555 RepID=UPI000540336D|nr:uncharacterized protein LOC130591978 [Beta vulgaris subsp. vulgaris]